MGCMRLFPVLPARACAASFLVTSVCVGCSAGSFVWVKDLPKESASASTEYLINTGDTVSVRVLGAGGSVQEAMSTRAKVRTDGRIAMPMLGDVEVRGKRPSAVRLEIEARLKEYLNGPSVTVNIDEFQPLTISVLGEVAHPGTFTIDPTQASVATLLANAGGLTEYADRDRIFVLRGAPSNQRIRFTWEAVSRDPVATHFTLRPGDVVVVE